MRTDLHVEHQRHQGRSCYVVKDPLALAYFRLSEEDFSILQMLDGRTSYRQIRERIAAVDQNMTPRELQSLVASFHQNELVVADAPGQGEQLWERHRRWRRSRWSRLLSVLAIRLPGVDPDRFLTATYPLVKWLYHPLTVISSLAFVLLALGWTIVQFDEFRDKLPQFHEFFTAANLVWLAIALACSKVLHELGHAYACKHFDRECHEIGVMFLVFTPCLYCDASDAWLIASKWKRAAIAAAGVYVELVLAAACVFVWWFSQPGLLHFLALSTMLVCSVSTLLFNANPLLRYDGYYILSDLLEIPNLSQRAKAALTGVTRNWCLGLAWPADLIVPRRQRLAFSLYAVSSTVYRWLVVVLILWLMGHMFEPYGLQPLAHLLTAIVLWGLIVTPVVRLVATLRAPGRIRQVKPLRLIATLAVVALLFGIVSLAPFPHQVTAGFVVQPRNAAPVYVTTAGQLTGVEASEGSVVQADQPLAALRNDEIDFEIRRLEGERTEAQVRLTHLKRRQGSDATAAALIPQTEFTIAEFDEQIESKRRQQKKLTLLSPRAGVVLAATPRPVVEEEFEQLPRWTGTPLDEENRHACLERGELFCLIGDPDELQAMLVIDQRDIEFVLPGQSLRVQFDEYPGRVFKARLEFVSKSPLEQAPPELSTKTGGALDTVTDSSGDERPLQVVYQALAPLDTANIAQLSPGFRGTARIDVGSRTIAQRFWRFLGESFQSR
jgi:putative peptide zinc metalloprotease protein